jgi:hypothetical protein
MRRLGFLVLAMTSLLGSGACGDSAVNGIATGGDAGTGVGSGATGMGSGASGNHASAAGPSSSSAAGTGGGSGTGGATALAAVCDEVNIVHTASCTPNNYQNPLVSYVAGSSLIFRGTVTALHATTAGFEQQDKTRMIVAHVDVVLFEGDGGSLVGQDLTVQLLAAPTMAVGYEGYFFSSIAAEGTSVLVTEVAHVDVGVYPTIESDVPGIEKLLADERLYARMQTASTVLVGTVTTTMPLPDTGGGNEHDPVWAKATIATDCVLRGLRVQAADVAFATSMDIAWFASPKLAPGQKGVFLLQPAPWSIPNGVPYVVTESLDVQPPTERAHVATLVLCPPG